MSNIFTKTFGASAANLTADDALMVLTGSYAFTLSIANNEVQQPGSAGSGYYRYMVAPASADYSATISYDFRSFVNAGSSVAALIRASSAASTFVIAQLFDDGTIKLGSRLNGSWNATAATTSVTLTPGESGTLTLIASGNTFAIKRNGTEVVAPTTIAGITAAGYAGLCAGAASGAVSSPTTGLKISQLSADTLDGGGAIEHLSTGSLSASSSIVSGSSVHSAVHSSSGAIQSLSAVIEGASSRAGSFITHSSSGALSASSAAIAASSSRSTTSVTHGASGAAAAGSATVAASSSRAAAGQLTTDILTNNTNTPLANTSVVWSWLPIGRIGALAAITPTDGTGTTGSDGRLTVSGLSAGAGILLVAQQNSGAEDDDVFYQAGTVT